VNNVFENFQLFVIVISCTVCRQSDDNIDIHFFLAMHFWNFSFYCLSVTSSASNLDTIVNIGWVIAQTSFVVCEEY